MLLICQLHPRTPFELAAVTQSEVLASYISAKGSTNGKITKDDNNDVENKPESLEIGVKVCGEDADLLLDDEFKYHKDNDSSKPVLDVDMLDRAVGDTAEDYVDKRTR